MSSVTSDLGHVPSISWARSYSNVAAAVVQQTSDGGYVVGGVAAGGTPEGDFWIVRLNRVGEILWQKAYGGGAIQSLQQTKDGGYIAASGGRVIRLDSGGGIVWQKFYYYGQISSIEETSDGGYIASGGFSDVIPADAWILRLDPAGNVLWQKAIGGADVDWTRSISQTSDGGFIAAGYSWSVDRIGHAWVLKFDGAGTLLWQDIYTGYGISGADSVRQTSDGGYIIGGMTHMPGNYEAAWLLKLDSLGRIGWQKAYAQSGFSEFYSVQQTSDGGYVAAGEASIYVIVVRVDSSGNLVWQRALGGGNGDAGYSVDQTRDGGFVVAGHTFSFGFGYAWVVKLNQDGDCCARINALITTPVIDTSASRITTNFTPRDTNVTVTNTDEVAVSTDAVVLTQCRPTASH